MWAIILDDTNFAENIKEGVALVDFWAEWCGPCQVMLPILADFAKETEWKVKVCKVNVDEAPALASQFRIMSIPSLLVFKDWKLVESKVWVHNKEQLNEICSKYM
jgi:thioredoxin 1